MTEHIQERQRWGPGGSVADGCESSNAQTAGFAGTPARTDSSRGVPGWLEVGTEALSVVTHVPSTRVRGVMVIAPSMGRESVVAHRALRVLALTAVAQGLLVLRFDWRGTGESTGATPSRPAVDWVEDLRGVVALGRSMASSAPVTVVGLRLGAAVAAAAMATEGAADHTIGWEPVEGKRWLREHKALRKLSLAQPPESAGTEVDGVWFDAAAAASLRALTLPPGSTDHRWSTYLDPDREAAAATYAAASRDARVPRTAIQDIVAQVVGNSRPETSVEVLEVAVLPVVRTHLVDGVEVHEEFVEIGPDRLPGTVTEPVDRAEVTKAAVLVPADAEPRDGPTGLWARTARLLAARGVSVLRADRRGMGEAAGLNGDDQPMPYAERTVEDTVQAVLHHAAHTGRRVVGVGLCSGAWLLLRQAKDLPLERVVAVNNLAWSPRAEFYVRFYTDGVIGGALGGRKALLDDPGSWRSDLKEVLKSLRNVTQRRLPTVVRPVLSQIGLTQHVGQLLSAQSPETVLAMGREDLEALERVGGQREVRRLCKRGASIHIIDLGDIDHALISYRGRQRVQEMLLNEIPG